MWLLHNPFRLGSIMICIPTLTSTAGAAQQSASFHLIHRGGGNCNQHLCLRTAFFYVSLTPTKVTQYLTYWDLWVRCCVKHVGDMQRDSLFMSAFCLSTLYLQIFWEMYSVLCITKSDILFLQWLFNIAFHYNGTDRSWCAYGHSQCAWWNSLRSCNNWWVVWSHENVIWW